MFNDTGRRSTLDEIYRFRGYRQTYAKLQRQDVATENCLRLCKSVGSVFTDTGRRGTLDETYRFGE